MKKQLTLIALFLFIITGISTGCKKENDAAKSLKKKIEGKWLVAKVETTIEGTSTKTYVGLPTDFFDFRNNDTDQLEVNIGADRAIGTYAILVNDDINLSLSGKVLKSVVSVINNNKFEFTATVDGASPKEVRKYFLTR